jgi:hypothetical protein
MPARRSRNRTGAWRLGGEEALDLVKDEAEKQA